MKRMMGILAALAAPVLGDTVVDFESGAEGWTIQNSVTIDTGGNPGNQLRHFQIDTFGVNVANSSNPAFIGDYTAKGPVTIEADFQVERIWTNFFGDVPRELVVEFRDYDLGGDLPYTSVWKSIGVLQSGMDWTTLGTTIDDPSATDLPSGWGGYGAEDPVTFEPILPDGVTFADVMSGVDEVVFTTFVPGFFFGFTNFDFGVDNVSITSVPEPGTFGLMLLGGLLLRRR